MEEKMLIKRNKLNIFQKLGLLLKKLFYKPKNIENMDITQKNTRNSNTLDEIKRKREVFSLQEKYEMGNILEKDMDKNEKEELIKLYKEQIKTLEENINIYQKGLEEYKNKIIQVRKKCEVNKKYL